MHSGLTYSIPNGIDSADIGYETSIYSTMLHGKEIEFAVGRPKHEYVKKHDIIYFPLYLIFTDRPVSCIGVYEIPPSKWVQGVNADDTREMEILADHIIWSISKPYFDLILATEPLSVPPPRPAYPPTDIQEPETDEPAPSHLEIPHELKDKTVQKVKKGNDNDVFIEDPVVMAAVASAKLPEETEPDAAKMRREYKESSMTKWIERFMKNNEYNIVDNEGGGDCLFAVIRDAFESIGKKTTVAKLRAILAEEATPELFEETRGLYMNFTGEMQQTEKELKDIKTTIKVLKKRAENAPTPAVSETILKEATEMADKYKRVADAKRETQSYLDEYNYIKDIQTFDAFKALIQTSAFWADSWAITTLERLLRVKIIILSADHFLSGDNHSVLQCGQMDDSNTGYFRPTHYILTGYTGSNHYTLITYKHHRIFSFAEIPYDVKVLVIHKCMERNAGPYYLIQDFRTLKTKFGLDADQGAAVMETDEEDESREVLEKDAELFEKEITFMFYDQSSEKPKAGKGSGEEIPKSRLLEFTALNKIAHWRRQLDDAWICPFEIDGKRWNSVEHYFLAAQYKKGFPDFFAEFSLNSDSEISKDIVVARAAASKSGKHKDVLLRNRKIVPDADFFEIKENPRHVQERRVALYAKFSQNLDLKRTLLETKKAKLVHFVRSREPEIDRLLMQLRKDLAGNTI